ncbi:YIP1 family protein [Carboxydothermus hydrogenoformans]|uniref:Yip1 domain-containing protein n=1 Tax=Carboxydothermus hydrogenoformans (strain ATCC BAA-161 / DSM 6008 / Z-2901) TaxID=246194 RepID=Q3A9Y1_CARHZ|nr:YIP1 family protein [Carboxydothermus hydrogenoformans]ABB15250.1 hypothetical protein CHY_2244 [Carboxydothermus hydrogenoformans Z-2901]
MGLTNLIKVIYAPGEVFQEEWQKTNFWLSGIIIAVLNVFAAWLSMPVMLETMKKMLVDKIPPEQLTVALQGAKISGLIGAGITPFLIWLLIGLVLSLYSQFAGVEGKMGLYLKIAVLSWVPILLGNIIRNGLVYYMKPENYLDVKTSFLLLLPGEVKMDFIHIFLSKIDFFTLWGIVLLGYGYGKAFNTDTKKSIAFWLIIFILISIISAFFGGQSLQKMA